MGNCEDILNMKIPPIMSDVKPPNVKLERSMPNKPIEITDENFATMVQVFDFLIVDCWAPWCGPCSMLSPVIDDLAREYEGEVVFGKLNTDRNNDVASKLGITSIPTLLFIKNGRLVDTVVGALPRNVIEDKIRKCL